MSKVYPVGLVGEASYQRQIKGCSAGERVYLCFERDNPHDAEALKVETYQGECIGYIGRSHWLRRAIHEDGRGCAATVASISDGGGDTLGVVLHVTLTDDDLRESSYADTAAKKEAKTTGWLSRLFSS